MGNKFEVYTWRQQEDGSYDYELEYSGDFLEDALTTVFLLKSNGEGYVKIEWR